MRLLFLIFVSLFSLRGFTQIDVKHYRFNIQLSDETDKINAKATIAISFPTTTKEFSLDLIQQKGNKGMKVEEVKGISVSNFQQSNDKLNIQLKNASTKSTDTFDITYSGIPADGLIISKNRFGDRTFFSDNWLNRGHNWISKITPITFSIAMNDYGFELLSDQPIPVDDSNVYELFSPDNLL